MSSKHRARVRPLVDNDVIAEEYSKSFSFHTALNSEEDIKNISIESSTHDSKEASKSFSIEEFHSTVEETKDNVDPHIKRGGWRAMPFIFANEIAERLAGIGFAANLVTYLTKKLHMSNVHAATFLTNLNGAATLMPIAAAIVADTYLGRFRMIVIGCITYCLGMTLFTLSATIPSLQPGPCCPTAPQQNAACCPQASHRQLAVVMAGFMILVMGTSSMRPCAAPFGADQLLPESSKESSMGEVGERDPHKIMKMNIGSFFNWYYFFLCTSGLIGLTVIVYIQDNIGWGLGFGIPTGFSCLAAIIFIAGSPLYYKKAPIGSPFICLTRVLVATLRKCRLSTSKYIGPLHELSHKEFAVQFPEYQASLSHTEQFKFLDRAAMKMPEDINENGSLKTWRLCTVTEVEELKIILRIGPIWAASIILIAAAAQQYTFSIFQAQTMDRHVVHGSSFQIPPASMAAFSILTILVMVPLYDRLLVPIMAKITGNPRGISLLQRLSVGFVLAMVSTAVSAVVELKRKAVAKEAGLLDSPSATIPMSVFYLLPQQIINGFADSFMSIGHLDFLYDQAPESMRSTATALFFTNYVVGSYLSSLVVTLADRYTRGSNAWLPNNLNRGHLDYFLWLLTILQLVNFLIFCLFAYRYKYKIVLYQDHTHNVAAP